MKHECRFFIGQNVVAIVDHSEGDFKKGDEFTIFGIADGCCSAVVRISPNQLLTYVECNKCLKVCEYDGMHYADFCFAPIQEMSNFTFEEAINLVSKTNPTKLEKFEEYRNNFLLWYTDFIKPKI